MGQLCHGAILMSCTGGNFAKFKMLYFNQKGVSPLLVRLYSISLIISMFLHALVRLYSISLLNVSMSLVSLFCYCIQSYLLKVSPYVISLHKNQHFQIPIPPACKAHLIIFTKKMHYISSKLLLLLLFLLLMFVQYQSYLLNDSHCVSSIVSLSVIFSTFLGTLVRLYSIGLIWYYSSFVQYLIQS